MPLMRCTNVFSKGGYPVTLGNATVLLHANLLLENNIIAAFQFEFSKIIKSTEIIAHRPNKK